MILDVMQKKGKNRLLNLEIRRVIYNHILKNPGVHLREISRELQIPKSTLTYHLNFLRKQDLIVEKSEGKFKRYYITQKVGNLDKAILSLIRKNIPRSILLFLFLYPGNSRIEIGNDLGKSPTTISYHLQKLVEKEVITSYRSGRRKVYRLRNQKEMYKFFITYEESLSKDISFFHLLNWVRHAIPDGIPRRKPGDKSDIDDVIETFYEIFPNPYHV